MKQDRHTGQHSWTPAAPEEEPLRTVGLRIAVGIATLSSAASAHAANGSCDESRIVVATDVAPRWRPAVERACKALAEAGAVDPTAYVRIAPIEHDLAVEVTLADGRSASRRVASADALLGTLEALLVVPPSPPDAPPRAAPVPARTMLDDVTAREGAPPPTVVAPASSVAIAIELGGGVGGRVAHHGYLSAAPGGFAELRVGSWLLGTQVRWDVLGSKSAPLVQGFEMETVLVGVVVARRMGVGFGSLDAGFSPRLAVETQTFDTTSSGEQSFSATDIRLGAFGRLAFGKSALRPIVELDADVSPSRLRRVVQLDPRVPGLPSWSAGLSAGVAWTEP